MFLFRKPLALPPRPPGTHEPVSYATECGQERQQATWATGVLGMSFSSDYGFSFRRTLEGKGKTCRWEKYPILQQIGGRSVDQVGRPLAFYSGGRPHRNPMTGLFFVG